MSIFKRKSAKKKETPISEEILILDKDMKIKEKSNSFMQSLKDKKDRKRNLKSLTNKNGG